MVTLRHQDTKGPLPTDNFDIVVNGAVVGFCQLRHKPSKSDIMPEGFENHIYCEIGKGYRNRGYATEALRQILGKAKESGLKEIIVTIAKDNEASQKIANRNGAVFLEERLAKDGKIYGKYKINLKQ